MEYFEAHPIILRHCVLLVPLPASVFASSLSFFFRSAADISADLLAAALAADGDGLVHREQDVETRLERYPDL